MAGSFGRLETREGIIPSDLTDMSVLVLKTMADPMRLQMLWALCREDLSLPELAQQIGVSPTVAGQFLSKLRAANVLQANKSGRRTIYSMHDERTREFVYQTIDFARYRLTVQESVS
ncbi:metalloregulator ArsR/SmtB family transcription factor [Glutamicibacter sp. JC586]|uniref:ArsR/SmtB family transcription factor n=1 Tax=Glutamicibacter sp. JC586 TaxID=2590552 RepID=UPI001356B741|nr:metalloregulator ArsR/SmtB family transcription factor [Glutamicibacter sp. JC586]